MISGIKGKLLEKKEQSVILDVGGLLYEIFVSPSVLQRLNEVRDEAGYVKLVTYYYFQIGPSSGNPVLIGFISEVERDFFLEFIKVSGIGPRAAIKAINKPISEISKAIDEGNLGYLKTLPGIGAQKAKEIVAKLQGKVARFGLIQDQNVVMKDVIVPTDWQEEALEVLVQLQYKKNEAMEMIQSALKRSNNSIQNTEELLNEIYKQKVRG